jgi:tetratricopeptide (TPR) repeat protein
MLDTQARAYLRQFLENRFSLAELKNLAFDLGVDYQGFPHESKGDFSRELVGYLENRQKTGCLLVEVLKQRQDTEIEKLLGQLPGCSADKKVQVIIDAYLLKDKAQLEAAFAQLLNLRMEQVSIIATARGSIRLLVSMPREAVANLVNSNITQMAGYRIISVSAFDELDYVAQEVWRVIYQNDGASGKVAATPNRNQQQRLAIEALQAEDFAVTVLQKPERAKISHYLETHFSHNELYSLDSDFGRAYYAPPTVKQLVYGLVNSRQIVEVLRLALDQHADPEIELIYQRVFRLLQVQEVAASFSNIGQIYDRKEETSKALEYYNAALVLYRVLEDRIGEADELNNIGSVYSTTGLKDQALDYYNAALAVYYEALSLYIITEDKYGEVLAHYKIASFYYYSIRQLEPAIEHLARCVELDKQLQHSNLRSDQALLTRWQQEFAAKQK